MFYTKPHSSRTYQAMPTIIIGLCTVEFELPGITTLKDKRSILKSLLTRLHHQFNISTAEVDFHDVVNSSVIAFTAVTTDTRHANQIISTISTGSRRITRTL